MTLRVTLEEALILKYILEDVLKRAKEVEADNITITLTETNKGYEAEVSLKSDDYIE